MVSRTLLAEALILPVDSVLPQDGRIRDDLASKRDLQPVLPIVQVRKRLIPTQVTNPIPMTNDPATENVIPSHQRLRGAAYMTVSRAVMLAPATTVSQSLAVHNPGVT